MFCLVLIVNVSSELYLQYISLLKVKWKTIDNSWECTLKLVILIKHLIYEALKMGWELEMLNLNATSERMWRQPLHGGHGKTWTEAVNVAVEPFPTAKDTLVSFSQLRNCIFRKCPLDLI